MSDNPKIRITDRPASPVDVLVGATLELTKHVADGMQTRLAVSMTATPIEVLRVVAEFERQFFAPAHPLESQSAR